MLDATADFFRPLTQSLRFADVLDVLLVAAFLYAFLTWVRRDTRPGTTGRLVVVLLLFAAVYLLAGLFSMYLVERLLEGLFIAFLVASVVLFQAEIRRMIDRIGSLSFWNGEEASEEPQVLDTIAEAAGSLAEKKTGALMALRGRDAWEGVAQGGVALDGSVSLPLLESIFHEKTAGHDGAVLIEEGRVVRFAAHLPLASELPEASHAGGTRHAAGLGLAEQSDAFVIVVSEERGTISVAEGGQLVEVGAGEDLRGRLGRFWAEHHQASDESRARWRSRRSAQTALLSVLMASLFWLAFAYEPGSELRRLNLPVVFRNVEPTWMIGTPDPPEVSVALSGPERAFRFLEPAEELSVSFPLSELRAGANELLVTEEHLGLPAGLRLQEARPQTVRVEARRLRAVRLPVRVEIAGAGAWPDSLRLRADPDSATLLVPRDTAASPAAIPTEAVAIDSLRAAAPSAVEVELLPPSGTRLPDEQDRSVRVRLAPAAGNSGNAGVGSGNAQGDGGA